MNTDDKWMSSSVAVVTEDKSCDIDTEVRLMDLDDFLHGIGIHMAVESETSECESNHNNSYYDINGQPNDDVFRLCDNDLKLHPIIRKSRKQLTPEEQKDEKYWHKRAKNNFAAKRSRESRRHRENQIVLRANFLEKENNSLKKCLKRLEDENKELRKMFQNC